MSAMGNVVIAVEEALAAEGIESVETALGVLQELPFDLIQQMTVESLSSLMTDWVDEQRAPSEIPEDVVRYGDRGFASRDEAINRQIVEAIQGSGEVADARAEYDIDAIADIVLGDFGSGFLTLPAYGGLTPEMIRDGESNDAGVDAFWDVVADHPLPGEAR